MGNESGKIIKLLQIPFQWSFTGEEEEMGNSTLEKEF